MKKAKKGKALTLKEDKLVEAVSRAVKEGAVEVGIGEAKLKQAIKDSLAGEPLPSGAPPPTLATGARPARRW